MSIIDPSGFTPTPCFGDTFSCGFSAVGAIISIVKGLFKKGPPPKRCLVAGSACNGPASSSKIFDMVDDILNPYGFDQADLSDIIILNEQDVLNASVTGAIRDAVISQTDASSGGGTFNALLDFIFGSAQAQSTTTTAQLDTSTGVGLLARIIFAEGAQDFRVANALEGIGSVILNRAASKGVGMPSTIDAVILQPGAFDGVNNPLFAHAQNPNNLTGTNAQAFSRSRTVAQGLLNGSIKDPTGRALFFFSGRLSQPPNAEFGRNIASGRLIHTNSFGNTHFFRDRDARF